MACKNFFKNKLKIKEISKEVMVNKSDRLYKLVFAGDSVSIILHIIFK